MTAPYSPPVITSELGRSGEASAARNSLSHGLRTTHTDRIEGVSVEGLVEKFGSPLFVFSERVLRDSARRARKAFESVYPNTVFAWSYKTNYLGAICNVLHEEGWIAEVVSDFEYQKARRAGIPGRSIIYNGPHKPRHSLERALSEGAVVQIDNWDELGLIEAIVAERAEPVNVGIRIWVDTGLAPVWSKFGFALGNGEARRAAQRIISNPRLKLHTLHSHIGTYILDPKAYAVTADRILALRDHIEAQTDHLVPCINLGGGFPSNSVLHGLPDYSVPSIEAYAAAIAGVLNKLPRARRPQLRLESGRHLVDEAGWLITSVVAVKGADRAGATDLSAVNAKASLVLGEHARGGYVVDAGINLLYTAAWYRIGVTPARASNLPPNAVRLYGCLCMNIDVIRESVDLPPLEVEDRLVLHPVGAYNVTQSMQFIAFRPAVVLIGVDGRAEVIRKREELVDVESCEMVPTRLVRRESSL
ncbi:alanine racemase [Labrys monachus]|uniref:Diaminopimelate decarboxylase n=1 Tax=Labrys monachus TaxID=217067 RepID=A0ABU0FIV9_9HYPH|nr:alanine racemase [Labrys monachus]MDQ0394554.1 diaminopimelate decarboxylase [Labrys monachus]